MAGQCVFNDLWLQKPEYKLWLQRKVDDVHSARCTLCCKTLAIASMGESALKSHAKNCTKHKELVAFKVTSAKKAEEYFANTRSEDIAQLATSSGNPKPPTIESLVVKNDVLDAEILWTLKTIKHHFSYKSNEDIEKIFRRMFNDSRIAQKFTCGEKKTAYYAVFGISPYLQLTVVDDLYQKNFVLLLDETLNIHKQQKQMDIHVRYWHKNKVSTFFYNSAFLGHSTSSDIFESFISAIVKLKFSKAIQISMDGPNVNLKFHSMLQDYFTKEFGKNLVNIGTCGLHTVHNSFKSGCVASTWKIEDFLTALYYLFKNSPARREDFLKESDGVLPKKFVQHRWLENVPASEAALKLLPVIKKYVAIKEKEKNKPDCRSYVCVKNFMTDNLLSVKLKIFLSIANVLLPFLKIYQTDKPMLPFLSKDLNAIIINFLQRFMLAKVLKPITTIHKLLGLDINDAKNHKALESIDLGFSAEKEIHSLYAAKKITDCEMFDLRRECKKFLISTTSKLFEKSPLNYSIVRNLPCLDPRNMTTDKQSCLKKMRHILNSLTESKLVEENVCEYILIEFSNYLDDIVLKHSDFSEFSPENCRIDELYFETMNVDKYKNLWRVTEMILLLSHGQATVERGFSVNKKIEVENMKEQSYIAQRLICDYLNTCSNNIHDIKITNTMRTHVSNARQKYITYLQDQKLLSNKRKEISGDIQELMVKKRCLENDIKCLLKSADELAEKAEENNDIQSVCQSNNLRRSAKEKDQKLREIINSLEQLKNN